MKKILSRVLATVLAILMLFTVSATAFGASATVKKVTGVTVIDRDEDEIELKWNKASSAQGYQVYMKHSNGNWVLKATVKRNYAEIKNLRSAGVYSFKVRAYKTTLLKKTYGEFSSVLKTATEPDEVISLTASSDKNGKTTLKWSKVIGASSYQVYKYNKASYKWQKVTTTTKTSYSTKAASGDKFKVRAIVKVNGKTIYGDFSSSAVCGVSTISYAQAKTIAFNDAKIKEANAREVEIQLEKTRSGYIYEVDFEYGYYEYEYEIDAATGKILYKETER